MNMANDAETKADFDAIATDLAMLKRDVAALMSQLKSGAVRARRSRRGYPGPAQRTGEPPLRQGGRAGSPVDRGDQPPGRGAAHREPSDRLRGRVHRQPAAQSRDCDDHGQLDQTGGFGLARHRGDAIISRRASPGWRSWPPVPCSPR